MPMPRSSCPPSPAAPPRAARARSAASGSCASGAQHPRGRGARRRQRARHRHAPGRRSIDLAAGSSAPRPPAPFCAWSPLPLPQRPAAAARRSRRRSRRRSARQRQRPVRAVRAAVAEGLAAGRRMERTRPGPAMVRVRKIVRRARRVARARRAREGKAAGGGRAPARAGARVLVWGAVLVMTAACAGRSARPCSAPILPPGPGGTFIAAGRRRRSAREPRADVHSPAGALWLRAVDAGALARKFRRPPDFRIAWGAHAAPPAPRPARAGARWRVGQRTSDGDEPGDHSSPRPLVATRPMVWRHAPRRRRVAQLRPPTASYDGSRRRCGSPRCRGRPSFWASSSSDGELNAHVGGCVKALEEIVAGAADFAARQVRHRERVAARLPGPAESSRP